jgi:hypothetical protein
MDSGFSLIQKDLYNNRKKSNNCMVYSFIVFDLFFLTDVIIHRLKICNESEIALTSSKGVSGKIVAVSGKERFGFYDTTVLYYIEVRILSKLVYF